MGVILTIIGIAIVMIGVAIIGLAISMIVKKNGKFPQIHIGKNKEMLKRGIHCASSSDAIERNNYKPIETDSYTK